MSVELFFGPVPPDGLDGHWIPTQPHYDFFVAFRLYGPTRPLFDKTWKLPDIERID